VGGILGGLLKFLSINLFRQSVFRVNHEVSHFPLLKIVYDPISETVALRSKTIKMLCLNYDSRTIDSVSDSVFFYKLIGKKVVKLNMSNLRAGEFRLVDILQDTPDIISLGIGVGNDESIYERKRMSLYNCLFIKNIIIHFSPQHSPPLPLPKNIDELALEFPFRVEGKGVGDYLSKVITRECKPMIRLIHIDKVDTWEGFKLPPQIRMLVCGRNELIPPEFNTLMEQLGFRRMVENQEYVFEKRV
jgi:hypothetical protein